MKLQYLIQQHQSELSELDRGILNYILSNGDTVLSMGIVELSEQVHVSKYFTVDEKTWFFWLFRVQIFSTASARTGNNDFATKNDF